MATKKKNLPYQTHGDIHRIIPLSDGNWAYLQDENGKLHHMRTDSDDFIEKCIAVNSALDGRIVRQLNELGWSHIVEKMESYNG
jgi:hypothetical protein